MSAELAAKLQTYGEQLAQVEQLLAADPGNEQFKKLRQDLLEVTKLTEDLLKYKHEQSEEAKEQANAAQGEAEEFLDVSPFQVGMRCEGKFDDKWYPAVITAVAGGSYTVVYIGFGNTEVVGPDDIRPLLCEEPLDPAIVQLGFECFGRFSGDGKYYDVVVEEVTDFGYKCKFIQYGNSEELPLEYLRMKSPDGPDDANELVREADGTYRIPEHLKVLHTDSEQERLRKRRRVKALKQKVKQREREAAWRRFLRRGAAEGSRLGACREVLVPRRASRGSLRA
mmetsp:Transcript_4981/g.14751  ORF Transcript_4981/g.14751 Transcript_4981/m.14751 type:complete len:282 (+) Transcript_4981:237-1082(+)